MVGACGVIGGCEHSIDEMAETLAWTGEEHTVRYEDAHLCLRGFTHQDEGNPGRSPSRDAFVWVWGNVLGFELDGEYHPRDHDEDGAASAYCARLYDAHALDFVDGLNGDYVGIVYDRERSTVSVFTDRLGTWRLFHTEADDGSVVFSSHLQALARYPSVSLAFDEAYVVQHFAPLGGPHGVKTPLVGVEMFPPGTVTTHDVATGSVSSERYWTPRFREVDEPYGYFVDAFVERFRASVQERTRDRSKRYGLLLSGGRDARLVLAALDDDVDLVAFHMAEWMSKEAQIAERIAMAKGVEFRFLRRDPDYFEGLLKRTPLMWNFAQRFNQAWAEGFIDEIRPEVDVLLTGHFCDTMFEDLLVPIRDVDLGPLGTLELPVERPIASIDEFIDELDAEPPSFVNSSLSISEGLTRNITDTGEGIDCYGVHFNTLEDLVLGLFHYPSTTDSFFRQSLREHLELQMPVLDNRLIDLWLSMPVRYRLRRDLVGSALVSIDPELASIPHAGSGVPVKYSKTLHRLGSPVANGLRRLSPFDAVPLPHLGHSPWGNHAEVIRANPFVEEAIHESEELIRALPFLDWEQVLECYRDHLNGADNTDELYRLVTLVKAPVTAEIAGVGGDHPCAASARVDER